MAQDLAREAPRDIAAVRQAVEDLARRFAAGRAERIARTHLDPADFAALAAAGWLHTGVPVAAGGLWAGLQASIRPFAGLQLALAAGDPAVALVASMHPIVLAYWHGAEPDEPVARAAFIAQRQRAHASALAGEWWGTATSEPGSGGDVMKTRSVAVAAPDGHYRLSGEKHFASGSGICRYMITTARIADRPQPDRFFIDFAGSTWDGRDGIALAARWDGMGMAATQSHAFRFDGCRAERMLGGSDAGGAVTCLGGIAFIAVGVAIVRLAMDWARARIGPRRAALRPFEQVGWVDCQNDAWLIEQCFEGALRAVEQRGAAAVVDVLRAKAVIATTAEQALARLARVAGGASFSRSQPLAQWGEDIRALGFLRPPWGYAWDLLLDAGD